MAQTTRRVTITIKQGDDHPILIPVYGDGNDLIDVTGWTARAQLRNPDTGELLQQWHTINGSAVCDAQGVSLLTDQSTYWTWTRGVFDVIAVKPDGTQVVPGEGTIRMRALVTRP